MKGQEGGGGFQLWAVPSWLTRERTSLLQKDESEGNGGSNYRPITCLPLMWKLLAGVIADQIYAHLDQSFYPKSRKGAEKVLEELMIYFILIGQ